ncbi:unnamed protein product [Calicophoron daubneyi]|uniref:Aminotransferase class I/classII large domain-containing protein n=1 Tax=Calicophoron daubneyi TaxID=300641 RepID=A0AAV2TT87_CALDB
MGSRAVNSPIVLASRVRNQKPNVWVEINKAVSKYRPLNLGQGFPDTPPKAHVLESLGALTGPDVNPLFHQYTRSMGHPRLVTILGKIYTPFFRCDPKMYETIKELADESFAPTRSLDPLNEIIVSVGAYGGLYAAISSLIDPGDEVIVMDPSFDCYIPMIETAGGVPVFVPLRPTKSLSDDGITSDDWRLDFKELESKITPETKMLILNTPHNPLGKVFDRDELEKIADICIRHNLVCLADEVYEWLVFPPKSHIKIASLPGMWNRTLTVGSAGKTFSMTGWKLGWTVGPARLIEGMQLHQQNTVYTCPTPIQEALARSLEIELPLMSTPKSYFQEVREFIEPRGREMVKQLNAVGMRAVRPTGGYFLFADVSKMRVPANEIDDDPKVAYDIRFNNWMMEKKGIAAIPVSVFYSQENRYLGSNYLRFCFFKTKETLDKFYNALGKW